MDYVYMTGTFPDEPQPGESPDMKHMTFETLELAQDFITSHARQLEEWREYHDGNWQMCRIEVTPLVTPVELVVVVVKLAVVSGKLTETYWPG